MATIGIDTRSDIWTQQAADAGTTSPVGGGSPLAGQNYSWWQHTRWWWWHPYPSLVATYHFLVATHPLLVATWLVVATKPLAMATGTGKENATLGNGNWYPEEYYHWLGTWQRTSGNNNVVIGDKLGNGNALCANDTIFVGNKNGFFAAPIEKVEPVPGSWAY